MKKSLLIAALAVFTMASCSKDEVIDVKQDAISFNVVAENTTKAAELFCSYNYMDNFKVYADFNTPAATPAVAKYIDGDEISVAADGKCTTPITRYWPELEGTSNSLTFYAIAGTEAPIDGSRTAGSAPTIANYTVDNTNVGAHEDLLYSVNANNTSKAAVNLNFRHALSLIQFRAKNTNAQLHVVIEDVMVGQVASTGNFSFPTTTTGTSAFEEHTDDSGDDYAENDSDFNCWSNQGTEINYTIAAGATIPAQWSEKVITGNSTVVDLTYVSSHTNTGADPTDFENDFNRSMLLIPQKTTANTATSGSFNGSYLAVNCRIYNIAGTSYAAATDVLLHEGWAIITVAFDWKPGNKYVYTFVFGEGNGGTDGGNDDIDGPEPGTDPVLFPISYTLTIDDFDFISDTEIDMKKS